MTIPGREADRKSQELPVCYLGGTCVLKLQALHYMMQCIEKTEFSMYFFFCCDSEEVEYSASK